tara:strand:+ start:9522 stop:10196 length:675 start_codon:yes stop_codon:yes gene_type:complete
MANDFRQFDGMAADEQAVFEQRFADVDRRRTDINAARTRNQAAYGSAMTGITGARDVGMQGARTSAMMPVYSMQAQSGLAGAYSGGQTQAASQASMQGATRASQLGATYADRIAQMEMQNAEAERGYDTQLTDVESAKSGLEAEAMSSVDASVQADMEGLRDANYMDVKYVEALMRRAASLPPGSRARVAYMQAARDLIQSDYLSREKYAGNENWNQAFQRELG